MTLKNGLGKCSLFVLSANGWKDQRHGLFVFPPKKTLTWKRHCSIGQSCSSVTSKRSIGWFLESSPAWSFFFTRAFAYPTKSHARLCPFDKPIKSLYFRSFVVSVLFARFHFKVTRKSLYQAWHAVFHHQMKHREESWKQDALRSIFDEFRGVSSSAETLCRMLDITSQRKWFDQEKLRMQEWKFFLKIWFPSTH